MNLYKAHSLKTFQAFIEASDDSATKNAVLLETTRAIFGTYNPGYITGQGISNGDSMKVLEFVKDVSRND